MKILSKALLIISTFIFLSGCDAQTLQAIDDFNRALSGIEPTKKSSSQQTTGSNLNYILQSHYISGVNRICNYRSGPYAKTITIRSNTWCPNNIR